MTTLQLTYAGVGLAVFANQLCLPVPSIIFLMGAGAISAQGGMRTSIIILLGVLGCLTADGIWFWFGRRWGSRATRLLCRFSADPRNCSKNARRRLQRYGPPLLCVSKFVPGLDGLMPPLSGAEGVSLLVFIAFDAVGALCWTGCYVGVGYLFSDQLDTAIGWAKDFATAVGIVVGVPLFLYAVWRGLLLVRMIRRLRLHRISPSRLARKLKSKSKVAVLDLLKFEPDSEARETIPGAFSVDPCLLRKSPQISVPDDVQIVLYSSTGGDLVGARVAVALNRIGIAKVSVLEGGLKAWREQGLPVCRSLEGPETVAARLGVKLPAAPLAERSVSAPVA